ncbi:MAG TPA: VCBS repeat-containing protein [Candidatus Acidoferrum sp.]|nr:VCBS repeat-containing protein [Candidatus Acidoferrum sp.]
MILRNFLPLFSFAAAVAIAADGEPPAPISFGFSSPETFPIDHQISNLRSADIDGDGLTDLIVVNNSRSRLNVLINQTGKTNTARLGRAASVDINDLPPDSRFRIESIASEKRIAALMVADLNHDKRPDIAYYGEPKELVVQFNQGTNGWSAPRRWPIEDGVLSPNALATGDLNGDGLLDLMLLGENTLYFLAQRKDGTLAEPEKIPFAGLVRSVQILDVNGDGRDDLLLVNWDTPNPLRFRLQEKTGTLGPEIHFTMPPIRSYTADDLDGDHRTEIVTIAQNSGRSQISNFTWREAEKLSGNFAAGQLQILPLTKTSKARRGVTWADVNSDGLPDLLVAEPESGQLTIHLQQKDGSLTEAKVYSTLTGVSDIAVSDWDNAGRSEIFLLSGDERSVATTRFDGEGKVAFPTTLPFDGKPLAMAIGPMKPEAKPTLAVVLDQDGRRVLTTRNAAGETKTIKLNESFKSTPSSMTWHDVNQDGLNDLVILVPYEKVKVLLQTTKGFDELDLQSPGGSMEAPWLTRADVDGDNKPELLLPQRNFLRAVVLRPDKENADSTNRGWSFYVKEQINGAGNNSRLVGAASLRNGSNAVGSLFLLDAERKALTLSERGTNGVWQIVRNLPLPISDYFELQPINFGTGAPNTVAFLGLGSVAWFPLRGSTWEMAELDGYETPIRDARLNDVVTGDLNQDGRKDLVFLETAKNYLDLVIFDKQGKLVPANRWPVFEERSYRGRRGDSQEPREAVIADFTGDKKADLAIIVHDRIIVYAQE